MKITKQEIRRKTESAYCSGYNAARMRFDEGTLLHDKRELENKLDIAVEALENILEDYKLPYGGYDDDSNVTIILGALEKIKEL